MHIRHLYKELNEIPRPPFTHLDGNQVYIRIDDGTGKKKKEYLGVLTSKHDDTI